MSERPAGVVERLNKRLTVPLAERLAGVAWITPDRVTWTSAACAGLAAPAALLAGWPLAAAVLVLAGAWLDSLDGDLARVRGAGSREGEILDAVLDRYIDFLLTAALILAAGDCLYWGLAALLGTQMVPYVRARTEAAGKASRATFGSRDVRNLILVAGIAVQQYCLVLAVLAVLTNLSAAHRFYHAVRRTREGGADGG